MKISINSKNDISIIELSGELDFHSSPELREKLNSLTDKKTSKILINLKKVEYMDSSGIATFVETFQKTKKYNGKLMLSELTPTVRGVFEIAKLESIFDITSSEEEGITKLNS